MTNETYETTDDTDERTDTTPIDVNRWIVTSQEFVEHQDAQPAHEECARLAKMFPGRNFRVLRVKSSIPAKAIVSMPEENTELVRIPPRFKSWRQS